MNILSLFDGISCGRVALERAGVKVDNYFASEIDEYAIKMSRFNHDDVQQIGNVLNIDETALPQIDLIMGGSPCQGFSFAGKGLAFDDPRSRLFFEFVDLIDRCKPKYFLLENVRMKKEFLDIITEYLEVEPILINSSLVSAQSRQRYYWTNIPNVGPPEDTCSDMLQDILEPRPSRKYLAGQQLRDNYQGGNQLNPNYKSQANRIHDIDKKAPTIMAGSHGYANGYVNQDGDIRKLTPIECERLQTLPDNYTDGVSDTQRYKGLGNGWTVDVVAHILRKMQ
jgi:DNA (cytosine-5)-methyltransferase 3A|tara:strand:- start:330 stop:1175 length:846 start_codon:yes stop_codon:yes gene_type:complete